MPIQSKHQEVSGQEEVKFGFKDQVEDMIQTFPSMFNNPEALDIQTEQLHIPREEIKKMSDEFEQQVETCENEGEYMDLSLNEAPCTLDMSPLKFDWNI